MHRDPTDPEPPDPVPTDGLPPYTHDILRDVIKREWERLRNEAEKLPPTQPPP